MKKHKLAIIDGYAFVFRAFYSMPNLTRKDNTPVGAVYGFINMLMKIVADKSVTHIVVTFDSGSKSFRNDIYPKYKANRPPCPEGLIPQFPLVREAAEALNLTIIEKVGFEADDIIATLTNKIDKKNCDIFIYSSDKDLMQLVDDDIKMFDPIKNKIIGEAEVIEKFKVKPKQVLDILSLMGDSSDNIPGVKGIGPKGAADLIAEFGNLENLLQNVDNLSKKRAKELLKEGKDSAILSKKLASLCFDVPLDFGLEDFLLSQTPMEKLTKFLQEQNFQSLLHKVKREYDVNCSEDMQEITQSATKNDFNNIIKKEISTIEDIIKIIQQVLVDGYVCLDYFTENQRQILTISVSNSAGQIREINYFQQENQQFNLCNFETAQHLISINDILEKLGEILYHKGIFKIGHNIKEFLKLLPNIKIYFDDIAILAYVLNSAADNKKLENIAQNYFDGFDEDFSSNSEKLNKKKLIDEIFKDQKQIKEFFLYRNFIINRLFFILKNELSTSSLNFTYLQIDRKLPKILAEMEKVGIKADKSKLKKLSVEFNIEIKKLAKEIHDLAGEEFNIASTKQLSEILYDKLEIQPGKKKGKSGNFSTNSEVLEEFANNGFIIADKILKWRHFSKLFSTYSEALQKEIAIDGAIHSNFSNISTITGRLSSSEPNLQNIPIKTEHGVKIRNCFVARDGHSFISADYSQIELRVLAHMAKIDSLRKAFINKKDIHTITAAQIFNLQEDEVTSEKRRQAKAINFGIIYGISAFGLAKQINISRADAKDYIAQYMKKYSGIEEFIKKCQQLAQENNFAETIVGRRCFIKNINSSNGMLKSFAQRLAVNAPIQGSAADIIKFAMIKLYDFLQNSSLKSRMILQIHDELIFEVPDAEINEMKSIIKNNMENALMLDVPLEIDLKISNCLGSDSKINF